MVMKHRAPSGMCRRAASMPDWWISRAVTMCAAPGQCVVQFGFSGAADAAQADLNHAGDPGHLGGAAHRAAVAVPDAVDLVAPVDVGVDLHDADRAMGLEARDDRDHHGIVAAEHDRDRAGIQDRIHRAGDFLPVAFRVRRVAGQVAAIDDANVAFISQQGTAEVEIMVRQFVGLPLDPVPQCRGRARAGALVRPVWRCVRRTQDRDVRIEAGRGLGRRKSEKCRRHEGAFPGTICKRGIAV